MTPEAIIHEAEEGGYWAEVPDLPGCFTQGETLEDLGDNIREAVEGWIAAEPCGNLLKIVPLNDDEL
jgi:predicted RNase H-like HicB family nuclease